MQVSTKGRYALRFLLDLAQYDGAGPVALKHVAERQGISKKYLEHVIAQLGPTGMLQITRGYAGGYRLARPASQITVAEVLRATEGGLGLVPPAETEPAPNWRPEQYMEAAVWDGLEQAVAGYLEGITLQELIDRHSPVVEYCI